MYRRHFLAVVAVLVATLLAGGCTAAPAPVAEGAPVTSTSSPPASTPAPSPLITAAPRPVDKELGLLANGLYRAGKVPAVRCGTPKSAMSSKAAMVRFARIVLDCLNRAWRPVVERSSNLFTAPAGLVDYSTGQASPCGPAHEGVYGFYCGTNTIIYVRLSTYLTDDADSPYAEAAVIHLLAHEYGHHVQNLVGISTFYAERYWRAEGAARLQENRRHELQGECLAAAFLGANKKSLRLTGARYAMIQQSFGGGDDPGDRTHGSSASSRAWTAGAYRTGSPSACNTFVAPAAKVS
ncbi:neutral zinc metallopeptidase [Kribbella lupini]|uniref:Neutral zinc metallopeptidase n=1 Tax=Kribbella lupini TaxID=291602 RepID=A0ABP4LTV8_9ACTN